MENYLDERYKNVPYVPLSADVDDDEPLPPMVVACERSLSHKWRHMLQRNDSPYAEIIASYPSGVPLFDSHFINDICQFYILNQREGSRLLIMLGSGPKENLDLIRDKQFVAQLIHNLPDSIREISSLLFAMKDKLTPMKKYFLRQGGIVSISQLPDIPPYHLNIGLIIDAVSQDLPDFTCYRPVNEEDYTNYNLSGAGSSILTLQATLNSVVKCLRLLLDSPSLEARILAFHGMKNMTQNKKSTAKVVSQLVDPLFVSGLDVRLIKLAFETMSLAVDGEDVQIENTLNFALEELKKSESSFISDSVSFIETVFCICGYDYFRERNLITEMITVCYEGEFSARMGACTVLCQIMKSCGSSEIEVLTNEGVLSIFLDFLDVADQDLTSEILQALTSVVSSFDYIPNNILDELLSSIDKIEDALSYPDDNVANDARYIVSKLNEYRMM